MPPTLSYVYTEADSVRFWLSDDGLVGRLDDDQSGDNNDAELAFLTQAITWASARINLYCLGRHAAADLAASPIVSYWCSVIAAPMLAKRRGNPVPASLAQTYEEVMEDLKMVRSGEVSLADVATRDSSFPVWSNVRVDVRYDLAKVRKQRPISSSKGDQSGSVVDRRADVIGPVEKAL